MDPEDRTLRVRGQTPWPTRAVGSGRRRGGKSDRLLEPLVWEASQCSPDMVLRQRTEVQMTEKETTDKHLFDSIWESYVKKDQIRYCRMARKLRLDRTLKNIPRPITSILEVGCGAGFAAEYLRKEYEQFTGLDYSQKLVDYAEQHNSSKNTRFICNDIKNFEGSQKFRVILMIGVLHHIADARNVLMNLKSHLEKGGAIVVNEPQNGNPLFKLLRKVRKKVDPKYSSDQIAFSANELKRIFEDCGYKIKLFPQGLLSTPLAETCMLPNFIGMPLAWFAKLIDSIVEDMIPDRILIRLTWNLVVEAREDAAP